MREEITPEEIKQHYSAMLDSVSLIEGGQPGFMSDSDWLAMKSRNQEHLTIMRSKDYWTGEDFSTVDAAIKS